MRRKFLSVALALIMLTALLPYQTAIAAVTTAVPGDTYYFDLSALGIPGTVNPALPDSSLHWVPFTYAGHIEAYSRTAAGVSTGGNVSVSERPLFIADYNMTTNVSWDALDSSGLIFGKDFSAYGAAYRLRAPSAGSGSLDSQYTSLPASNEWDRVLQADSGYIKNYDGIASWGQDSSSVATDERKIIRGGSSNAANHLPVPPNTALSNIGYRPVLQPQIDNLHVITLVLNGGRIGGSETVQIVVSPSESTYTAPVREGITRPAGNGGRYLRWNTQADGKGTDYEPGSQVPSSVTTLYAKWAPVEQYSLATGETYYFDLSGITIPGTVNADTTWWGSSTIAGLPDTTLHYVPFTYYGTIDAYSLSELRAATDEWAAANISERSLFMADYQINYLVTWNQLNEQNLIFGRDYQYNGIQYRMRAPSVGSSIQDVTSYTLPASCEWNRILEKAAAIKNDDRGYYSIGQDTSIDDPDSRIMICYNLVGELAVNQPTLAGYRPVLQINDTLEADGLKAITLNLGGGSLGGGVAMNAVTGSIKIVVRKGSAFTAPGAAGITRPDGVGGEYFMWEGSDGSLYAPGASVPAGVTSLTAVYEEAIAPTITTASLPDGTVNGPYSRALEATGDAPITWSITGGSLPDGLSLDGDTISGTPTEAGTFSFTVKAQNSIGSDTKVLSITVEPAPPVTHTITASADSGGSISPSGSVTVADGGSVTFTVTPDAGCRVASVIVDGEDKGAAATYTFEDVREDHTIRAVFEVNHVPRTLTDSATGVAVSGNISEDAVLTAGSMTLGSDEGSDMIHLWMDDEDYELLLGVDISLSGSFTGPLTLTLDVGERYNGRTVTILHAKQDGKAGTYTAVVRDGKVTFDVTSLSTFAVFLKTGLDDIPETGDAGAAWVWWTMLAVSAAGAAAIALIWRKPLKR